MSAAFERVPHSRAEKFDERRPLNFFLVWKMICQLVPTLNFFNECPDLYERLPRTSAPSER